MSEDCRFCNIINGKYKYQEIDKPFFESEEFIAIASIGALVEGWSLIVPKQHEYSMREFYGSEQLTNIIERLLPAMSKKYGRLIAFEHGANRAGSMTSCGTDHAHLHIVPFDVSLLSKMKKSDMEWVKVKTSEIKNYVNGSEYLFYYDVYKNNKWVDPTGYLHVLEKPTSQYFRKLIADYIGVIDYDYKRFPNLDISKVTNRVMNGLCASF